MPLESLPLSSRGSASTGERDAAWRSVPGRQFVREIGAQKTSPGYPCTSDPHGPMPCLFLCRQSTTGGQQGRSGTRRGFLQHPGARRPTPTTSVQSVLLWDDDGVPNSEMGGTHGPIEPFAREVGDDSIRSRRFEGLKPPRRSYGRPF